MRNSMMRPFKYKSAVITLVLALAGIYTFAPRPGRSQDWFTTGINLGAPRIRLAVAELPSPSGGGQAESLVREFNEVLRNDLDNSGIFDLVSKSLFPLKIPLEPQDVVVNDWSSAPASARMLIFGKAEVLNSNLALTCRLYDLTNSGSPSVLARRYVATMN